MNPVNLTLYAVLDPRLCRDRDPALCAAQAAQGGASALQYRAKNLDTRTMVEQAKAIKAALRPHGVPLIVNDRVDVALAAAADGVHLGRLDMAPDDARRLIGADMILGVTVHHAHEAAAIPRGLPDYAGLGPVYATTSKDPGDPPLGPDGLRALLADLRAQHPGLPASAIAGINAGNAAEVFACGIDGIAVLGALFLAEDITASARGLRALAPAPG